MNRVEFQQLAEVRLREAEALLAAGFWDGTYYLAGYAVECGLKACVLRRVEVEGLIFDEKYKTLQKDCWTHRLDELLKYAGLEAAFQTDAPPGSALRRHWATVREWTESSRYQRTVELDARNLITAVADPNSGVLRWIRTYW